MRKNKWLRFLPFLPLLLLLICVNIYLDAGNRFHEFGEAFIHELLSGSQVYIKSGNISERDMKMLLLRNAPQNIGGIIIGSSTSMCVSKADSGTANFFNLGVSNADFYDMLAFIGFAKACNKNFGRVIISPTEAFFDEKAYNTHEMHVTAHNKFKAYADYMINYLDGKESIAPNVEILQSSIFDKFTPIFSLTYFQANIKAASGLELAKFNDARIGIVDKDFNFKYWSYMPDGSLVYSMKQQQATSDDVIKACKSFALKDLDVRFAKNAHASEYSKKYLDKLIKYLISSGTQVEIFLCPLAPALWDAYDENLRPILPEAENYCHELASKYNLKLTGSYNPYKVGIRNSDYYDARHIRRERLSKYFDFKP
ncbi:MAG: hypothetical protein IJP88_00020 [Synergistaceae bacterium]|nr:hypothetical protein [Synergistaceae bacterium]MBR0095551.1 hypothetical protein [Synergistaceae bacterium]